jgi:hypothetical protein
VILVPIGQREQKKCDIDWRSKLNQDTNTHTYTARIQMTELCALQGEEHTSELLPKTYVNGVMITVRAFKSSQETSLVKVVTRYEWNCITCSLNTWKDAEQSAERHASWTHTTGRPDVNPARGVCSESSEILCSSYDFSAQPVVYTHEYIYSHSIQKYRKLPIVTLYSHTHALAYKWRVKWVPFYHCVSRS